MKKIFGPATPHADVLEKKAVLTLVNSHPAVDYPESLPPNIVQVGGMQIKEAKPVPKDLDDFLKKGKKGSVFLALGTNFRSDELGKDKIDMVVEAFRQFPDYNFLWKFETTEMLKDLPPNVKISAWLPQNDILAHPSVKLFITHGGLLSTHETTWWGKPQVGIPIYSDQHRNIQRSVSAGVAQKVDFLTISVKSLISAISEVLGNPKYRKKMEIRSKNFRDQPEKPMDRAAWWCEYIIRNPQPAHLKPAEFNLGLLGSHFWDIQVIIISVFVLFVLLVKRILYGIFKPQSQLITNQSKKRN